MASYPLYIGDTWTLVVTATDASGNPLNLTSQSLTPSANYWTQGQTVPTNFTVGTGITLTNPTAGVFMIQIPPSVTKLAVYQVPGSGVTNFPTRVQVLLTDISSNIQTIGNPIEIIPLDPRQYNT